MNWTRKQDKHLFGGATRLIFNTSHSGSSLYHRLMSMPGCMRLARGQPIWEDHFYMSQSSEFLGLWQVTADRTHISIRRGGPAEHKLGLQRAWGSIPGISRYSWELLINPGEQVPIRVGNDELNGPMVSLSIKTSSHVIKLSTHSSKPLLYKNASYANSQQQLILPRCNPACHQHLIWKSSLCYG